MEPFVIQNPENVSFPELKKFFMFHILKELGWNRTHAAKQMGISIRSVRNWINDLRAEGMVIPDRGFTPKSYIKYGED